MRLPSLTIRNHRHLAQSAIAILVALNYFAFRVELFDRENEENHPQHSNAFAFASPSTNWESFDKDNASKAFTVEVVTRLVMFTASPLPTPPPIPDVSCFHPTRDKSPPLS